MRIDLLSIFPDFFHTPLTVGGIVHRAQQAGILTIGIHNIRAFAEGRHQVTDWRPYGGGEGMVMKAEPLAACLESVPRTGERRRVVLMSPRGALFSQARAQEYAELDQLVLICGRYEGVDERFTQTCVDEECSLGDYVLSGGELAALVVTDAVCRLLPGALGCADSAKKDSFRRSLLKHHQYTKPLVFAGLTVPEVLRSGDHGAVDRHRFLESVRLTLSRRPDLLPGLELSRTERKWLDQAGLLAEVEAAQAGTGTRERQNGHEDAPNAPA